MEDLIYEISGNISHEIERLEHKQKYFCEGCDDGIVVYDSLSHFGAPCFNRARGCEPGGDQCAGKREYELLERALCIMRQCEGAMERAAV